MVCFQQGLPCLVSPQTHGDKSKNSILKAGNKKNTQNMQIIISQKIQYQLLMYGKTVSKGFF